MFEMLELESEYAGGELIACSDSGLELWEFETDNGLFDWQIETPDSMAYVTANFQEAVATYMQWDAMY